MALDRKISILIQQQLPDYVKEEYPLFIHFIEAYYEWMEQQGFATDAIKNLLAYQDIDTTLEGFILSFQKEFLNSLPSEVLADKRLLVKHIRQFYLARGTEKSYKFLFNILFQSHSEFYFPNRDILRLSDGKWIENKTLRVAPINDYGNPYDLVGRKIIQPNTNAIAFVENVKELYVGGQHCFELFLNRSSISGSFTPNETIRSLDAPVEIRVKIYPIVSKVVISEPGEDYLVGDIISVSPDADQLGAGFSARVSYIDPNNGGITGVNILDHGVNYNSATTHSPLAPSITFRSSTTNAQGYCVLGAILDYDGFYLNEDGQTNTTKYIQDGHYYQQFSYVTILDRALSEYSDIVKRTLHPAGLKLFGEVRILAHDPSKVRIPISVAGTQASWIHIQRQQFWNPDLNIGQPYPLDLRNRGIIGLRKMIPTVQQSVTSFRLGASFRSLEREKFWQKPSSNFSSTEQTLQAPNAGYWDTIANYQIAHFENLIIGDVEDAPWTRINIMPEPILTTSH